MTKYLETIRLTNVGLSQRNIICRPGCWSKTIVKVQHRARELNIQWSLDEPLTDKSYETLIFS